MAFMKKLTDVQQLAVDIYNNRVTPCEKFSNAKEADDKLRDLLREKIGDTNDIYALEENKIAIFRILSEILTVTTSEVGREIFEPFAEFIDLEFNETKEFEVEDDRLYDVALISTQNNNLQRQKMLNKKVKMESFEVGVKIYAHFNQYITGKIDLTKMINRVTKSIEQDLVGRIGKAFVSAYSAVPQNTSVTGTMDRDKLTELIAKIEGLTGTEVSIYGSKTALAKIPGVEALDSDGADRRNHGYVKVFNGVNCIEIKNTYNKETNTWGLANDKLFIVPSGSKPIMVGFEGQGFVFDGDRTGTSRLDRQIEYLFTRRAQIAVIKAFNYGVYTITGA